MSATSNGPDQSANSALSRLRLLHPGPQKAVTDASFALPPHIVLAVDLFPKNLGGGERVLLRLASLLPEYGFQVSVLTLGVDPESSVLLEPVPCPIYLLPLQRTYNAQAISAALELSRFLRAEKVRLVQTFFESSDLWVGPVAKMLAGTALIWSRRDMGILRERKHRLAYRFMANLPDRVFAVSDEVRRHCIEVDGIPAERVETLYNGVDVSGWEASDKILTNHRRPIIKTVGNIRHVKGHDIFLRAAALIARDYPEARFCIAGGVLEPEFYRHLQRLARELHIEDRISFDGAIADLPAYLADATIFALPSRSEGFSNAIIEAMAAGLPVIATDVGGNAEAVQTGITGLIVPPEDVPALSAAMHSLLANPERARKMGRAGRARVAERFTTEAMMRQIVAAYQQVLGREVRHSGFLLS